MKEAKMSVDLKQKVISGDLTKSNFPENTEISRILTASPDLACLVRQLRKNLEDACRRLLSLEKEVLTLKNIVSEKAREIKKLNDNHVFASEKLAFLIGAKDAEISNQKSSHSRKLEALRLASGAANRGLFQS